MTFKNHGCCGHIFPALDAITDLRAEHHFTPADIEAIHVAGYGPTKDVCDRPSVATEQEARFSLQYCVSALLHLGGVRLAAFAPEALANQAIHADMAKTTVSLDPGLADAYPGRRAARVTLRLRNGTKLERYQPTRKGDPDAPLTDTELADKFRELTTPVIGPAAAEVLRAAIWTGAAVPGPIPLGAAHREAAD
jgi:2-methylcitrate dehydratase PrpD